MPLIARRISFLRWAAYGLFALLAYAVAMLFTLPAGMAYSWATPYLKEVAPQVQVGALGGTVWDGRAGDLVIDGRRVGAVQWTLSPWPLLWGEFDLTWHLTEGTGYLDGAAQADAAGNIRFDGLEGRFPATELMRFAPPGTPVAVSGELALNVPTLAVAEQHPQTGRGTVVWSQARVVAPQDVALGDLKLAFTVEAGQLQGQISDAGGPLEAQGQLSLAPDGGYRVDMTLRPRASADEPLRQALKLMGQPNAEGRIPLRFSGRL